MSDQKDLTKGRFGAYARGYVTSQTHAKGADLARLVAMAEPQADWHALDIATGGGHTALAFAPHVAHVIASDLTPQMLDAARAFIIEKGVTNVDFQLVDAEALPFDTAQFALVSCRIAPHHFPHVEQFIAEVVRVLKPGGVFALQDQIVPEDADAAEAVNAFERLRDPSHHRALTQAEWVAQVGRAGIFPLRTETFIKHHQFHHWAKMQGNDAVTITALEDLMDAMPEAARRWMLPDAWRTDSATFANRHVLLIGKK